LSAYWQRGSLLVMLLAIWASYYLWKDKMGLGRLFRFARGGSGPERA
jgi:hypothetical protein